MPFPEIADVTLACQLDGDERRWMPRAGPDDLIERARVEPAEPPRQLSAQRALRSGADFRAVAAPVIRPWRNPDIVGDGERLHEALACRDDVDFAGSPVAKRQLNGMSWLR